MSSQGTTHRLNDMEVEEISLVTVPANKEKFLIVKHDDGTQENLEIVPKAEGGGFTLVHKDDAPTGTEEVLKFKMTKDAKEALVADAGSALEKLNALVKAMSDAEESDDAEVPGDLTKGIEEVGGLLKGLLEKAMFKCTKCTFKGVPAKGSKCPKCGADMEQEAAAAEDDKKKKPKGQEAGTEAPESTAKMDTEEDREKIGKAAEAHAALLNERLEAIVVVAKDVAENAKTMEAKDLKAKLRQLESMGWKLSDPADVVNVLKSDAEVEKLVKAAEQRGEIRGMSAAFESLAKIDPLAAPTDDPRISGGAGKNPPDATDFEGMFGSVPGLAEIAKEVSLIKKRLDDQEQPGGRVRVGKSVGAPRSGGAPETSHGSGKVAWPLDMNP